MTSLKINDTESAHRQPEIGCNVLAAIIGAPMNDDLVHPREDAADLRIPIVGYNSNDAAHSVLDILTIVERGIPQAD
jgi:hypothetical protein